jgi:Peptidase A4 family
MATIKTANNFSIATYPPPPTGFDPGVAEDTEVSQYGLSPFLSDELLRSQLKTVLKTCQFIEPQFEPRKVRPKSRVSLDAEAAPLKTPNWSGAIVPTGAANPVVWVQGNWTVPSLSLPINPVPGRIYAASPWIGIDGELGSQDILQAGCDGEVILADGGPRTRYRLWYEWYPGDSNFIPNMPIAAGDAIGVIVRLQPGSNLSAAVLINNQSRNVALTFGLTAANGFGLVGNCTEWIVECNPELGALGNFGIVNFTGCSARIASGATATPANAIPVMMIDAGNRVLSAGEIAAADSVRVRYVQT